MKFLIFYSLITIGFFTQLKSQLVPNNQILPANNVIGSDQCIHQWYIGHLGNHFIFPKKQISNTKYEINSVEIYPNPTTGLLQIQQKDQDQIYLETYNNVGRLIIPKQSINGHSTLDLSASPKGIYFLKVYSQSTNLMSIKKIIKI